MSRKHIAVYFLMLALLFGALASCDQKSATPAPPPEETPPEPPSTMPSNARFNPIVGALEVNNMLPNAIDRNMVQGSFTYAGEKSDQILSGDSDVRKPFEGHIDSKVKTDRLFKPAGAVILRAEFDAGKAMTLLGSAVGVNAAKKTIALTDEDGKKVLPIGFVWAKVENEHHIRIDRNSLISNGFDIPFRQAGAGEHIYLYWQVPSGTKIKRLFVGQKWFEVEVKAP